MFDSRLARSGMVFAAFGLVVFFMSAFAITDDNEGVILPIGIGGLALALLAGLVIGLAWALRPDADRTNTTQEARDV